MYDRLIKHIMFNPKICYIDVNSTFAGYRLCEPTEEGAIQAQVANSWLRDLQWTSYLLLVEDFEDLQKYMTICGPKFCRICGDIGQLGELQKSFHQKREGLKKALKEALRAEFFDAWQEL